MKELRVAIIGYRFMGRAHSHAWRNAPLFLDVKAQPILKAACGRKREPLKKFARKRGWQEIETDWRKVVQRKDIDISVPHQLHYEIALAAARTGKHIFCEKPLALDAVQAEEMMKTAQDMGVVHYVNFNYRRCPAVALARQLIGSGHQAALNSHSVDFHNGARGSFETSRFATGRRNFNCFEIYGSRGSVSFNLERLNELEFFSLDDPEHERGYRTILATERMHRHLQAWWPPGHIIGYEHSHIHAVADFINAVADKKEIRPDFEDGWKCMQVLDAGLRSAREGRKIDIGSIIGNK